MTIALELVILLALILVNGILAMSELAVVSARKLRLQQRAERGDAGAAVALQLAAEPTRFLSTVQIGITLVGIFAGAFGGATVAEQVSVWLGDAGLAEGLSEILSVAIVVVVIAYLSLVVGELVPKRIALQHPEGIAAAVARPMRLLSRAAAPVVALLSLSTDTVLRLLRIRKSEGSAISEEEIRILLQQSTEAGVLHPREEAMASAVLRLGDRNAGDVMTPRPDVVWVDRHATPDAVRELVVTRPHGRYPVADHDVDHVIAVVALKDLVAQIGRALAPDLGPILRPALFIPESLPAIEALERIREAREPLAVVVDEHGGTAGVVTLADIVSAIVGEFSTTDEPEDQDFVRRPDGSLLVDGAVPVDQLKEELGADELPDEDDYATFAGFVLHQLGRIPVTGERFEWDEWAFEVVDMDGRRVDKVLVRRRLPERDD
jgi:putative hemolysin